MHSVSALYNSILSGVHTFEVKVTNGAFADGVAKVTLPEIRYAKPGTYRYLLTEDKTANSDDAVYRVTVTVGEDQKAKTSYELVYGEDM